MATSAGDDVAAVHAPKTTFVVADWVPEVNVPNPADSNDGLTSVTDSVSVDNELEASEVASSAGGNVMSVDVASGKDCK